MFTFLGNNYMYNNVIVTCIQFSLKVTNIKYAIQVLKQNLRKLLSTLGAGNMKKVVNKKLKIIVYY